MSANLSAIPAARPGQMPKCFGIVPARYQSSRFPGKPLASILGRPMFYHVCKRAMACPLLDQVILATDSDLIAARAEETGIAHVMTSPAHRSGTDRVYEAACLLGLAEDCVVVNIQGDEPALHPDMLVELLNPFIDPQVQVSTLVRHIDLAEAESRDIVKVVADRKFRALYFSRSIIPYDREGLGKSPFLGHIGLYAFRMPALRSFTRLPPSELEQREALEQLRLLENGLPIQLVLTRHKSHGVDRPEDIQALESILQKEQLSS